MADQDNAPVYEPPALIEVGDFAEETHGAGSRYPEGAVFLLTL